MVETYKMTATVTGIDADNRKATLVSPDGKKTSVKCGPEVINFDQIQVGDQLKIRVTQELAVRFLHGNYAVGLAIPFGSMTVKGDITHTGTLGSSRQLGKTSDTSSAWPRGEFGRASRMLTDDQQVGTVDHTPVYPREVVKRALELSATALILVHNHPSGDPTPSRADIQMTQAIIEVARPLGIAVHDHIIVGKEGHASFKGLRLI